jgi:hypothetical protein
VIQGIKICSKIKVLRIARKHIHGVDLVLTNPKQLERVQTNIYARDIRFYPLFQIGKILLIAQSIQTKWQLTVQSVRTIQLTWQGDMDCWHDRVTGQVSWKQGYVDQLSVDTCQLLANGKVPHGTHYWFAG